MFCKIISGTVLGICGKLIYVEADLSDGLPSFIMVGMPSTEVKEAGDRVRTALKNSGYVVLPKRITINLSPADIRKEGTAFDLPIAVSLLYNLGIIQGKGLTDTVIIGELGLNGEVHRVNGVLSIVAEAKERNMKTCLVPKSNAIEGAAVKGIQVIGVSSLKEVVELLNGQIAPKQTSFPSEQYIKESTEQNALDFSQVNGQKMLKRAAEVAAAGMHNLLMVGSPGSGKTMIAKRIPGILPKLDMEECIELTKIYSVAGKLTEEKPFLTERPFRAPHHTISASALTGGGRIPKPGEITLAGFGVLFLDELTEFQRNTLETLRQPMEEKKVLVSRVTACYEYPANFMLVAAMNPCRCGYFPDRSRCNCGEQEIKRYLGRISRPLLDRIDICVEAPRLEYQELNQSSENETSAQIRMRIEKAWKMQKERYQRTDIHFNNALTPKQIQEYCKLEFREAQLMKRTYERLALTARGYFHVLKVARTIADLEGSEQIKEIHLSEAIAYRSVEKKFWK